MGRAKEACPNTIYVEDTIIAKIHTPTYLILDTYELLKQNFGPIYFFKVCDFDLPRDNMSPYVS